MLKEWIIGDLRKIYDSDVERNVGRGRPRKTYVNQIFDMLKKSNNEIKKELKFVYGKELIYDKGLAEALRYILHYGGVDFEDVRIPQSEWSSKKDEISPPFGKLPIFVDGDRVLNQSVAIARYIGRGLDLVPSDPWEEASLDAVILTLQDLSAHLSLTLREQDETKKAAMKKEIIEETIPFYYSKFDKMLKENNGHFGNKLSWADFVFAFTATITDEYVQAKIMDTYPHVKSLVEKIHHLPGVKEYITKSKN